MFKLASAVKHLPPGFPPLFQLFNSIWLTRSLSLASSSCSEDSHCYGRASGRAWIPQNAVIRPICDEAQQAIQGDRKSTRLNSSHLVISYAVFCLKKKNSRQGSSVLCPI